MLKRSMAAMCMLALAACGQGGPFGGGQRAPAHPSQSQATASGESRQVRITPETRAQVEANIRDQLNSIGQQFASGSVSIPGVDDVITAIQPGTDYQYRVALTGGVNYTFFGACDGDCSNIDLELLDGATGAVVGSDLLPDDYPVVNYTPQANGPYYVRLILRNCTQAPCFIGGRGVQQQPTGAK